MCNAGAIAFSSVIKKRLQVWNTQELRHKISDSCGALRYRTDFFRNHKNTR
ncbi:hypothetical protein PN451_16695 [Dolichospermum planctonicum CS-1226]|uniref:Glutaminase n=1 Tax=Dolichospermum planctonicum CS-1226 TaxID=3021751 RepID=A0ABT5AJG5_9CYAN|nr:hypothetical protein [Dolichospermum planctonicum]MDB9537447.1 hypothetical protein [Dolichospermum planctonicum CS-1226]